MTVSRLVVCESTGRWAAAIRRRQAVPAKRLYETRGLEDCWDELRQHPASLVAVELTPKFVRPLVNELPTVRRTFPRARIVALSDATRTEREWSRRIRDRARRERSRTPDGSREHHSGTGECVAAWPDARRAWEWLLREAGVIHVVQGVRSISEVERIALRHFDNQGSDVVEDPLEAIWEQLPWPGREAASESAPSGRSDKM